MASQRLRDGKTASIRRETDGTWSVNLYDAKGRMRRERFATRQAARAAFAACFKT